MFGAALQQERRIRATVSGQSISLTRSDVLDALEDHTPADMTQYWVEVGTRRWPMKQAFSIATGLPHTEFTTQTASRHFRNLGFNTGATPRPGGRQPSTTPKPSRGTGQLPSVRASAADADVLLVGCVRSKRDNASPAKDLYTSPYFTRMRRYAEASGRPWYILSAQHGLVRPDARLEPYDCYLPATDREYRRQWGELVAEQLQEVYGPLAGAVIEIHAGSAYVDAATGPLTARDATVLDPLHGLTLGQRLAWYTPSERTVEPPQDETVTRAVALLSDGSRARSVEDFLADGRRAANQPGMYSWWVDERGAADLSRGLGHVVTAGLVYAGLAGATRAGGSPSTNTLWGRIATMHLGRNRRFSTLRRSLGALMAAGSDAASIDETELTHWMHDHLRVVTVPVDDRDSLDRLETAVLSRLDPPLNLMKMPPTPLRRDLRELRRRFP